MIAGVQILCGQRNYYLSVKLNISFMWESLTKIFLFYFNIRLTKSVGWYFFFYNVNLTKSVGWSFFFYNVNNQKCWVVTVWIASPTFLFGFFINIHLRKRTFNVLFGHRTSAPSVHRESSPLENIKKGEFSR